MIGSIGQQRPNTLAVGRVYPPIPSVRVFDLSSRLDLVQSGQVDVALGPDTAVDWAMVRVRITVSN
ncbi:MAG TPA: hypothetical protein VN918_09645 [Myxococcaceae bacterium]|nr:hypothetical protein [Myxococcaceae bacterium]